MKGKYRILLEECIMCVVLEGIVSIPAVGITQAFAPGERADELIGVVYFLVPLVVVAMHAYERSRPARPEKSAGRGANKGKWMVLGIGLALVALFVAVRLLGDTLAQGRNAIAYLSGVPWVVASLWIFLRQGAFSGW